MHDVATTIDRLESAVAEFGGIKRIARVDQAEVARLGGARVAPAEVLIIENPGLVAELAAVDPELLSELPIRVFAWQDAEGQTWVRTAPPSRIGDGDSDHPEVQEVRAAIDRILGGWLDLAVAADGERSCDRDLGHRGEDW
ncbi:MULTISPECIES: DUF302 domain-containing protein [unclassified Microbacterium]|uniref:DUF302 domain-containing protein n=1 Tax=unclassified Microbacterium TaxID=2609290 RepID=UPI0012F7E22F